jgi:hypothetical protein
MSDTWYFFYQTDAKSTWTLSLASERDRINRDVKPELNTVLDVNSAQDSDKVEDKHKLKYKGPMYFDFDSEDRDEVILHFKQFLTNLKAKSVNLNSLRIFASGGKGFHVEMPQHMLMAKIPPHGIQALPLIYREVAHALFVNTLDLRVYSLGKGRQWRCPNIKRANGNYKVQITVEEAMNMTSEMYEGLVKYPRPVFPVEEAVFSPDIALIYSQAREKVESGLKVRSRRKKQPDVLARFKGNWPKTISDILSGGGALKEQVGWNYLAMQLAITADALGKSEDDLLKASEGLLETYAGDGKRYGSAKLRKQDLINQYRYHSGNVCSEFSIGGIFSLLQPSARDNSDLMMGDYTPDPEDEAEEENAEEGEEGEQGAKVKVNAFGMFTRTEFGWKNISHLGVRDPTLLIFPETNAELGYDTEVFVNGKPKGRQMLPISSIGTKAALHSYAMRFNTSFRGTEMDAGNIVDLMRHKVESKSKISLVTQVEGMDLILPPDCKEKGDYQIIWASQDGVTSLKSPYNFSFKPMITQGAHFKTDLFTAKDLSNCDEDRRMIQDLLSINSPHNMAKMIGWFTACFFAPLLRHKYKQFPLMMVFGGATAGKSKTIALLNHMFYNMHRPKVMQAAGMTKYTMLVTLASTGSIPFVLEELRPRLMQHSGLYAMFINAMKSNYDGHDQSRGGLSDTGKGTVVNEYANTAPVVFTAEEQNAEVAIQERSVQVSMTKGDRVGREAQFMRLLDQAQNLGRLGKAIAIDVLALEMSEFYARFNAVHKGLQVKMGAAAGGLDRPIYNLATVLMGLEFMKRTVGTVFASEFDEKFDLMTDYIYDNISEFVPKNMSEASKILDVFAQLTKTNDISVKLEPNRDYYLDPTTQTLDLKLKPCYAKYMRYCRSLGLSPLIESDGAFIQSMTRYEGVVSRSCPDSPIFDNPFEAVFRLDTSHLEKEGVEPFKG